MDRYWFRVVSLAKRRIYSSLQAKVDADDIAQESFAAFFEKAQRGEVYWEKPGDLWRLVASIAIHKLAWHSSRYHTAKRNLQRESGFAGQQVEDLAAGLSEDHEAVVDFSDLIESTIAREKPMMRSLIRMLLAGYTNDEISQKLDRSPRTVRRLIKSLRVRLADQCPVGWHSANEARWSNSAEPGGAVVPTVSIADYHLHRMTGQGTPNETRVRIIDFGFAGTVSSPSPVDGGTEYFMAPELTNLQTPCVRSLATDVFAFGKTIESVITFLSQEQRALVSSLDRLVAETTREAPDDRPSFRSLIREQDRYFSKRHSCE